MAHIIESIDTVRFTGTDQEIDQVLEAYADNIRAMLPDGERARHDALVFASLNATGLAPDAVTPFCETYIRQSSSNDGWTWHLVNHPERGWASHSYWYRSLRDCLCRWNVVVIGAGTDKHSFFYRWGSLR